MKKIEGKDMKDIEIRLLILSCIAKEIEELIDIINIKGFVVFTVTIEIKKRRSINRPNRRNALNLVRNYKVYK